MIVVLAIGILLGLVLALLFIKGYKSTTIIFSIIVLAAGMVFFKEGQDSKQEQQNQVKLANRNDDENNDTNLETKNQLVKQIINLIILKHQNHLIREVTIKFQEMTTTILA